MRSSGLLEGIEPAGDAVANGDIDAAIVGTGAQPMRPPIRTRVVATEPLVLAVRRGDPLSSRRTATLTQLREQPMITLVRGSDLRTVLDNACRTPASSPGSRRRRATSLPSSSSPP